MVQSVRRARCGLAPAPPRAGVSTANVRVPPNDRARLEHLCRYLLRPPLVQDRLRLRADGRLVRQLKTAWRDGTTHLVFEPLEFLAKLAALTPRPEINLLVYHGVLAPHARWRPQVVGYGRAAPEAAVRGAPETRQGPPPPLRNWTWAALMRRAFAIDVLACPRCGGRLRVIATVEDPLAVRQILAAAPLGPARRLVRPPSRPDDPWSHGGARSLDSLRRIGPARASPRPHRTTPKSWTPRIPPRAVLDTLRADGAGLGSREAVTQGERCPPAPMGPDREGA